MTRLDALHVTSSPQTQRGAVTCLRGFRPWRLAARRVSGSVRRVRGQAEPRTGSNRVRS